VCATASTREREIDKHNERDNDIHFVWLRAHNESERENESIKREHSVRKITVCVRETVCEREREQREESTVRVCEQRERH